MPNAESCQHIQGRGGAGLALDTSPCLALVETSSPSNRQKGPPQVGPETTWEVLPGKHHPQHGNSPVTTGQQVSQPHVGPWGSPAEAHVKPRGTKLGLAARAQAR